MNVAKGSRDLSMVWLLFKHKLLHQSYILHTWPQFVGFFFFIYLLMWSAPYFSLSFPSFGDPISLMLFNRISHMSWIQLRLRNKSISWGTQPKILWWDLKLKAQSKLPAQDKPTISNKWFHGCGDNVDAIWFANQLTRFTWSLSELTITDRARKKINIRRVIFFYCAHILPIQMFALVFDYSHWHGRKNLLVVNHPSQLFVTTQRCIASNELKNMKNIQSPQQSQHTIETFQSNQIWPVTGSRIAQRSTQSITITAVNQNGSLKATKRLNSRMIDLCALSHLRVNTTMMKLVPSNNRWFITNMRICKNGGR